MFIIKISQPSLVAAIKAARWRNSDVSIASPQEALVASQGDITLDKCARCGTTEGVDRVTGDCLPCFLLSAEERECQQPTPGTCECGVVVACQGELCDPCWNAYNEQERENSMANYEHYQEFVGDPWTTQGMPGHPDEFGY